jgi:hypothetical protein
MSGLALLERFDIFFATAAISAQANAHKSGFRQRDVRFYVELFTNYVAYSNVRSDLPLQNVHILRFLTGLVGDGYARVISRGGPPRYQLSRGGVIELLRKLSQKEYYDEPSYFCFVFSFLDSYATRILSILKQETRAFPYALELEVLELLSVEVLCKRQLDFLEREKKGLEKRIQDQIGTRDVTKQLLADGRSMAEVLKIVERKYPYLLHTKKSMSEFYGIGTERQAEWELLVGGVRRNEQQYIPALERLELQAKQIEAMLTNAQRRREKDGSK